MTTTIRVYLMLHPEMRKQLACHMQFGPRRQQQAKDLALMGKGWLDENQVLTPDETNRLQELEEELTSFGETFDKPMEVEEIESLLAELLA